MINSPFLPRLELEKVSYAPMTWAELHLFTERLSVDHRKRDMKLRITRYGTSLCQVPELGVFNHSPTVVFQYFPQVL